MSSNLKVVSSFQFSTEPIFIEKLAITTANGRQSRVLSWSRSNQQACLSSNTRIGPLHVCVSRQDIPYAECVHQKTCEALTILLTKSGSSMLPTMPALKSWCALSPSLHTHWQHIIYETKLKSHLELSLGSKKGVKTSSKEKTFKQKPPKTILKKYHRWRKNVKTNSHLKQQFQQDKLLASTVSTRRCVWAEAVYTKAQSRLWPRYSAPRGQSVGPASTRSINNVQIGSNFLQYVLPKWAPNYTLEQ